MQQAGTYKDPCKTHYTKIFKALLIFSVNPYIKKFQTTPKRTVKSR